MSDASGPTNYTYNNRNRLISKATPEGTLSYTYDVASNGTVGCTYDAVGNRKQLTSTLGPVPDGLWN